MKLELAVHKIPAVPSKLS